MTETPTGPKKIHSQSDLFFSLLADCLNHNTFVKLVLGKYHGSEPGLERVFVRRLTLREGECLSFLYRYQTKDITKNLPMAAGIATIRDLFATAFNNLHLQTVSEDIQLSLNKKGKCNLQRGKAAGRSVSPQEHDREKERFLDLAKPFLKELGVTNGQHQLIPSMSRKWKQINKFIEVLDHAIVAAKLKEKERLRVVDFGSGKGYLTFAMEEYLRAGLGLSPKVTGVELREDLVALCSKAAQRLKLDGLSFTQGDIRSFPPESIDIMIALHACDMATDYAIHLGIRSGAGIIMCAPCCHKQIRPQMQSPELLRPMLKHGIHMGQEAEMVTDSLRALLLEASGYETRIFEFVSLEHTSKNKMILGVKGGDLSKQAELLAQIREIKEFYSIREHCLESLLLADGLGQGG
ncbi:MAG: SAM-dependent methyltransferase [Desulfobulbaceae bacterium]|nr:SAM-dependent methyltransferase [Desulfobulbaceae bacterium]HIJ89902.1 SAM-dependent methyltransferase [Deltaproteobacteria bacterium]